MAVTRRRCNGGVDGAVALGPEIQGTPHYRDVKQIILFQLFVPTHIWLDYTVYDDVSVILKLMKVLSHLFI